MRWHTLRLQAASWAPLADLPYQATTTRIIQTHRQRGAVRIRDGRALNGHQQAREVLGRQRTIEEKALPLLASLSPQECQLLLRFHALGNDPLLEVASHADHGADDGRVVRIGRQILHEGLVDFQGVDRETLQVTQARIAGTKIIDRQLHTHRLE